MAEGNLTWGGGGIDEMYEGEALRRGGGGLGASLPEPGGGGLRDISARGGGGWCPRPPRSAAYGIIKRLSVPFCVIPSYGIYVANSQMGTMESSTQRPEPHRHLIL